MCIRFRLNRERNRDVWVENIMAPAEVTAEELFPAGSTCIQPSRYIG